MLLLNPTGVKTATSAPMSAPTVSSPPGRCRSLPMFRFVPDVYKRQGYPIDFYITIDLDGFVELVDAVGGVEFDVPVETYYSDPTQDLNIFFQPGMQHLEDVYKRQVLAEMGQQMVSPPHSSGTRLYSVS